MANLATLATFFEKNGYLAILATFLLFLQLFEDVATLVSFFYWLFSLLFFKVAILATFLVAILAPFL